MSHIIIKLMFYIILANYFENEKKLEKKNLTN